MRRRSSHDVSRAASEVAGRFGGAPSILINNAGHFVLGPAHQLSPDEFRSSLDVNLLAPFLLARAFLPAMLARGTGHIVSIRSIADHMAFPENAAYSASKYGLRGLHEVLRAELRGTGVHATLISPGPTDTPLWDPVILTVLRWPAWAVLGLPALVLLILPVGRRTHVNDGWTV